jgi:preprotein translocase subunit SecG
MKNILILLFALIIALITTTIVLAQPGLPSGPAQAPIDGGLGLLAAAGGAYALKKLRDRKDTGSDFS